jgi:hypothetical protein
MHLVTHADFEGDESFEQTTGENTFTALSNAWDYLTPGAVTIALISFAILIFWDVVLTKKHKFFQVLQGPIVVVLVGIAMNLAYQKGMLPFSLDANQIVSLPVANGIGDFVSFLLTQILANGIIWQ